MRLAGTILGILAIAMLRREREDAADDGRPVRRRLIGLWIALTVLGFAVAVWAIFAS